MAFHSLEKLHRIHEGFFQTYRIDSLDIFLVQYNGKLYGYKNYCPHQGAPMTYGTIIGGAIRCPLHGIEYRLDDGEPANGNTKPLEPIQLIYEGNSVGIEV
ncbi:Rieske (2Fe-2S) protein [Halioxenophilus sp. WMMB6]|uniref:Rieske (2Fe-2S) protein n=1 Tax=Halioxenophilus sp. WMMB6 TaxID=3073815 RepID=UPI00295E3E15|nr:Rieske (2Fe-2S) protein [Halioxenophilus sp. WMMB6]